MALHTSSGRSRRVAAITAATLFASAGAIGLGSVAASAASDGDLATPVPVASGHTFDAAAASKLGGSLATSTTGRNSVFVQLAGSGAADVAAATSGGTTTKKAAANARRGAVDKNADAVVKTAKSEDAKATALYTVSNAVPGVAVSADSDAIDAMAARDDVVKITPIVPKKISNSSTAVLTKALATWRDAGNTGKGVTVGVIDTGIDYTHADFGGPGTVAAWNTAHAHSTAAWTPTAKVAGGYDFVGDDYDADPASANYQPVPHPDVNPLGCDAHGTHVSGTVAGYGENADGSTFTGSYAKLTSDKLMDMKIGPGMAPEATLYALKVFGCTGSTDEVIPALDWSLDPNGDGDFSDHLDVVNMSLGSDYGTVDDPENAVVDNLAKNGVLPVIAMGNNGDLTDTGGSPGNAVRSLAVASSVDAYQLRDGLKVNAPSDVAGIAASQFSVAYPWATAAPVTGDVVAIPGANADGCTALSAADAAKVKGKVAWLVWDDNDATRRCGSVGRSGNVAAAGAIGAIFTSGRDVFGAGITGSTAIPVVQLPKTQTDRLQPAVTAGTLNVTFDGSLQATIKDVMPAITDTLSTFSSRGTHGSLGVVKPDVTAPGDTVASAGLGSGNGVLVESGTSMATPHVAGISALVKAAHPSWSAEAIKAAVMNTAGHDLYTGTDKSGHKYGPARVGAGRVDALAAVDTSVIAYDTDVRGGVSASFGVVEAPANKAIVTEKRTVRVQNTGSSKTTVTLKYQGVVKQPGVTYSVSPTAVAIPAHSSKDVKVTMTVVTADLRKTIDPTMDATQVSPYTGADEARQYVSDASGRLLVTPSGKKSLRVPVYGAAKPASTTTTKATTFHSGKQTLSALTLKGKGVSQGSGSTAYRSLVSVLQLGAKSPKLPVCTGTQTSGCTYNTSTTSGDLKYVGTGSVKGTRGYSNGELWIGLATFGDWATIGNSVIPYVQIDATKDGKPDFEVDVQNAPSTDLLEALVYDLNDRDSTGAPTLVDVQPVNYQEGDVDTNVFDNDVLLVPVNPAILGVKASATSFPITYAVGMFNAFTGTDVDDSPAVAYDVADPAVQVSAPLFADQGNTSIVYSLGSDVAKKGTDALVLHLQGTKGSRAEVVHLDKAASPKAAPKGKQKLPSFSKLQGSGKHYLLGGSSAE
ncbi:S8 family peptidase [Luteimicrobium subarcticum]|uniref:Subtilase family protein n=1 Tax=Luteimicrobium subarcticum TaxID=620910 RepID=A0A2M8W6W8_9MICO|nr:S8 family serine peptidase [Luteimicrobium subarcticum]PJI86668.1 subtilase family protein [Luteimicrobium subarcticum]